MFSSSRLIACVVMAGSTALYAAPSGSYIGSSLAFSVPQKTQVPGGLLKPGDYTIHVLDQLSDRMIVRVDNDKNDEHTIFLGIPHSDFSDATAPGPVVWKTAINGSQAMRGFEFASGSSIEFVYPKNEAAALAKSNAAKVVAVDPESEGRPVLKKMSQEDMQVVTLWMLSLTTESPNSKTPALQAQKYTPDTAGTVVAKSTPAPTPAPSAPTQVARVDRPQPATATVSTDTPAPAPATHPRAMKQLPKTGSSLPLVWLVGLFSVFLAAFARIVRLGLRRSEIAR